MPATWGGLSNGRVSYDPGVADLMTVPECLRVYYVTALGWYHLSVFTLLVPWMAWRSRARVAALTAGPIDRVAHFRRQSVILILFGALSVFTASRQGMALFPAQWPSRAAWVSGAVLTALAVAGMRPVWQRAVIDRRPRVQLFVAETPAERVWWLVVATLAGVSEEITWRAVQFALLTFLFGNAAAGALGSALLFALGHWLQGWRSMVIIGVFALAFQGMVALSGSLYVAMAAHAVYDVIAGVSYGSFERARRLGEPI